MAEKLGRYQFSMRSLFAFLTVCAFAFAFPHVAVFTLALVCVILASRAMYKSVGTFRSRLGVVFAFTVAWIVFYALSIGPFIAVSEFEKRTLGRSYIGRFGCAYRPLVVVSYLPPTSARPLLWYAEKWIPSYATGLPVTTDGNRGRSEIRSHLLAPIVGTWKSETGTVINFRPDGTARWRPQDDERIGYLEWTLDSDEFVIYQYSSKYSDNAAAWFARRVMMDDTETERCSVVEITPTRFRLRDGSGKTISFAPHRDAELESAP
ncbi:MAG TPA: hypothetical protein EYP56_05175 [Planctomycetaceae bacterium]|nr:hypothetical protein [Planctomycetaceae bacterium]